MIVTKPGQPNLDDPSRCASTHWYLSAQCELPPTHRDNWHQTTHPETGNKLRYRFQANLTEELIHGQWHQLVISRRVGDDERKVRNEIADAIRKLEQEYPDSPDTVTALDRAETIALGPLLEQGRVTREVCGHCEPQEGASDAEQ